MEYKMSIKNFEMKIEGKTENGRTTMKTTIKPFTVEVGMRVRIAKRGHTFEGYTGTITSIVEFRGRIVDVEIVLDAGQDMKGGLGKTGAKPKSLELITR